MTFEGDVGKLIKKKRRNLKMLNLSDVTTEAKLSLNTSIKNVDSICLWHTSRSHINHIAV